LYSRIMKTTWIYLTSIRKADSVVGFTLMHPAAG
jgi:hypothetical protein